MFNLFQQVMGPIARALDILQADGGEESTFPLMGAGYIWPTLNSTKERLRKFLSVAIHPEDSDEVRKQKRLKKLTFAEPLAYHMYHAMHGKLRFEF